MQTVSVMLEFNVGKLKGKSSKCGTQEIRNRPDPVSSFPESHISRPTFSLRQIIGDVVAGDPATRAGGRDVRDLGRIEPRLLRELGGAGSPDQRAEGGGRRIGGLPFISRTLSLPGLQVPQRGIRGFQLEKNDTRRLRVARLGQDRADRAIA